MKRSKLYLSTIGEDAAALARKYGLGLEIADYCWAYNIDCAFEATDRKVQDDLEGLPAPVLHASFNELFPCAIDPKARELARERYRQAIELARRYGASKIVIHGGYQPTMYFPEWYTEQSAAFWREFMEEVPRDIEICLENVLEPEWRMLGAILQAVDCPNLRMCLDIGHVAAYSKQSVQAWLEGCGAYISHFHIHNNDGHTDWHRDLTEGVLPMAEVLALTEDYCPDATYTIEVSGAAASVEWLMQQGLTEE